MAKLWNHNQNDIPWLTNEDEEDFVANINEYCLRVEQLDTGVWWWSVSFQHNQIMTTFRDTTDNKFRAIGLAEGLYEAHRMLSPKRSSIEIIQSKLNRDDANS